MTESDATSTRPQTYLGLFFVTLSSLMYEIVLTRIFSVTMWYHFAFVAISVALFGLTAGALLVHLRPARFAPEQAKRNLAKYSLAYGVSMVLAFITQLSIPVIPDFTVNGIWSVALLCAVISVPFIFSGIVVCIALTQFPHDVNRLYAVDLLGAGLGCIAVVALFSWFDGPSLVVFTGALAVFGAVWFAIDARHGSLRKAATVVAAGLALLGILNANLQRDSNAFLKIIWAKESRDRDHQYERWNSFSRITVDGNTSRKQAPGGFGLATEVARTARVYQMGMVIDSTAGTVLTGYTGKPEEISFLRSELTNLAHNVKPNGDVLVIGVGGGRDILSALAFNMNSVTGVEINGNILHATNKDFGDFTGHLDQNPKVKFVNDEARSYLARTDTKYDIIQISLIDTWAATSAGAYALSENSLYTVDAWKVFFDSLKPGGVLSVSRWYTIGDRTPVEVWRTASLAAKALEKIGVENPRDHVLIYKGPPQGFSATIATVLVSPTPFTPQARQQLAATTARLKFEPVVTADFVADSRLQTMLEPGGYDKALDMFDEDVSAPTDNRPFFFQMASLRTLFTVNYEGDTHLFEPVLVLVVLALVVLVMAAICLAIPLRLGRERKELRTRKDWRPFYLYFAGIGLGFLLVEISQLQRLSTYLGHPTRALGVVLFSVLTFSGIGSMATEKVVDMSRRSTLLRPLHALMAVGLLYAFVTPSIIKATESFTTPARMLVAVLLIGPLGFLMGMPFSLGMRLADESDVPKAFLWGINGALSVCSSVFAVVIGLFFGIRMSFLVGMLAYTLAVLAMRQLVGDNGPEDNGFDDDNSDAATAGPPADDREFAVTPA